MIESVSLSLVVGWGIVCFLAVASFFLLSAVYREFKENTGQLQFFEETGLDGEYNNVELPQAELDRYYSLRTEFLSKMLPGAQLDQVPINHLVGALRALGKDEKSRLKAALMRRAIRTVDGLNTVSRDRQGVFRMYEKKLVADKYFESLLGVEKELTLELRDIQGEAEKLESGWGKDIIGQAVHYGALERRKALEAQKDAERVEAEKKDLIKEQRAAELEKLKQETAARKAAEALIREEEAAKRKANR